MKIVNSKKIVFEIGKCYRHTTGQEMHVIGELDTVMYGNTLVAETTKNTDLTCVGRSHHNAVNWKEISHQEWMKNFS